MWLFIYSLSMLDTFYISLLQHYKKRLGKKSLTLALFYINLLELSIILAIAAFALAFASQMKMVVMSLTKFWILYGLVILFITFKNWMRYNGKKRIILNAKVKPKYISIYLLWLLPIGCFAIAFIMLQIQ